MEENIITVEEIHFSCVVYTKHSKKETKKKHI